MSGIAKVLASDEFEGRAPGTPGETRTVEYLVAQFKALGLEPGGEAGGWTQAVPLVRTQVPDDAKMSVTVAGVKLPLVQHENVEALSLRPVDRVADRQRATRVRRLRRLGAGARLGRLQGRRPQGQGRGLPDQRSRLRGRARRCGERPVRRERGHLLRALDLQVRGSCTQGRDRCADRPRDPGSRLRLEHRHRPRRRGFRRGSRGPGAGQGPAAGVAASRRGRRDLRQGRTRLRGARRSRRASRTSSRSHSAAPRSRRTIRWRIRASRVATSSHGCRARSAPRRP